MIIEAIQKPEKKEKGHENREIAQVSLTDTLVMRIVFEIGNVVEIEILNASKFLGDFLTGMIRAKPKARMIQISA